MTMLFDVLLAIIMILAVPVLALAGLALLIYIIKNKETLPSAFGAIGTFVAFIIVGFLVLWKWME